MRYKKQKAMNEQTKQTNQKFIDTDDGMVVTRGEGACGKLERVNGV